MTHTRRQFVGHSALLAGAAAVPTPAVAATVEELLKKFDPFGTQEQYFGFMRPILFDIQRGRPFLDAMWKRYLKTGDLYDGERTLMGMFLIWRVLDTMKERVRYARAAQVMADKVLKAHPEHPAGYVWGGIFFGAQALAAGVLDSIHLAPEIETRFQRAMELDPGYIYGLVPVMNAKLYIKAPAFPMSIGNMSKGYEYLEIARPYAEKVFAPWYIVLAEAELLTKGDQAALEVLQRMRREVVPIDTATAYSLDTMISDAKAFEEAIATKKYSKYFFDPFLQKAVPGLP